MDSNNSQFPQKYKRLVSDLAQQNGITFEQQLEVLAAEALEHCGLVQTIQPESIFLEIKRLDSETINIPYFDRFSGVGQKKHEPPKTKFTSVPASLKRGGRSLFAYQIIDNPRWGIKWEDIIVVEDSLEILEGDVILVETKSGSHLDDYVHTEVGLEYRIIQPYDIIQFDQTQKVERGATRKQILGKVLGIIRSTKPFRP